MRSNVIEFGDCRDIMRRWAGEGVRVQTCVTSPPYFGLRDYGVEGQIGLEQTPEEYIAAMVEVFRCVRDVLADDGTLWVNIGDSYASNAGKKIYSAQHLSDSKASVRGGAKKIATYTADLGQFCYGCKPKDLIGIPWMLAFALRADGWYLRQDIIWHKPNPMPESVRDRCTKAHEYVFLLSKSERYFYDGKAVREPITSSHSLKRYADGQAQTQWGKRGSYNFERNDRGRKSFVDLSVGRNRRSVWTVATRPYKGAHFATFPPALIEPCILAGSRPGDIVLDPFMGSGTTAAVARQHGRQYLGCELNRSYAALQNARLSGIQGRLMFEESASRGEM